MPKFKKDLGTHQLFVESVLQVDRSVDSFNTKLIWQLAFKQ